MAQLAYHVSMGIPLWGYAVNRGTVLYLALEDDHRRLQDRLYRMFGENSTENLYFAVYAKQLNKGLETQLKGFIREHPDTRLIIIDTLQKIREDGGEKCSYASDYDMMASLKSFADESGVCLLLVHHTRKQQADDRFDMISGTNGLLGAADGAFLLQKERRTDCSATLDISGRDQQDQRLYLTRNNERLIPLDFLIPPHSTMARSARSVGASPRCRPQPEQAQQMSALPRTAAKRGKFLTQTRFIPARSSALALRLKRSALSATATFLTTAPKLRGRWTAAKHGRGWNWIFRQNMRSTICSHRIQRFPAMTAAIRSYCLARTETTAPRHFKRMTAA